VVTAVLPSHWIFAVEDAKTQVSSEVRVTASAVLTEDFKPENPKMPMSVLLKVFQHSRQFTCQA
jgi:hypothetical protein